MCPQNNKTKMFETDKETKKFTFRMKHSKKWDFALGIKTQNIPGQEGVKILIVLSNMHSFLFSCMWI